MRKTRKLGKNPQRSAEPDPVDGELYESAEGIVRKLSPYGNLLVYRHLVEAMRIEYQSDKRAQTLSTVSVTALLRSMNPADAIEEMLAAQMVANHFAAMECLQGAALPNQTYAGRDLNLKYASKLSLAYARLVDALNKHRGKGQQKVTVEHVHVESGGQAMVGNIEAARKKHSPEGQSDETPKSVSFEPGTTLDVVADVKVPVKPCSE